MHRERPRQSLLAQITLHALVSSSRSASPLAHKGNSGIAYMDAIEPKETSLLSLSVPQHLLDHGSERCCCGTCMPSLNLHRTWPKSLATVARNYPQFSLVGFRRRCFRCSRHSGASREGLCRQACSWSHRQHSSSELR